MSLSAALSNSVISLAAFQQQTQLLSSNVGNAQNPNYTRKVATLSTPSLNGLPGAPVISQITRAVAPDVQQDLYAAQSDFGRLDTAKSYSRDLAELLDTTNTSGSQPALAKLLSNFEDAWTAMNANPEDPQLGQEVIQQGVILANRINQLNARQTELRTRADESITTAINTINDAAVQIQKLNVQITAQYGAGQPTGDLEDLRDVQVQRITNLVGVRTLVNDRGELFVYTEAGVQITGTTAQQFTYTPSTQTTAGSITYTNSTTSLNGGFLNGSVKASLDYLDPTNGALASSDPNVGMLGKFVNQLDSFALNLVNIVNTAYAAAENRVPAPTPAEGTDFFHVFTAGESGFEAQFIAVEPNLVNGTESIKSLSGGDVQQAMQSQLLSSTQTNPVGATPAEGNGLLLGNVNIFSLVDGILAYHAKTADTNDTNQQSADTLQHTLDQKYRSLTGVDVDNELANLQVLQNNYAAMANVLNSITKMFDDTINIGR